MLNINSRRFGKIIEIQENERERIASDLHDELGPVVSIVKLQLQSLSFEMKKEEFQEKISEAIFNVDMLAQNIKYITRNLSTSQLNKNGLIKSIEQYQRLIEVNRGINFQFEHEFDDCLLTENARRNIYRIIQELINNTLKHSNCNSIGLGIKKYEKKMLIVFCDNGTLNNSKSILDQGMGILNIKKRIELLNGNLTCKNSFTEGSFYHILLDNKTIFLN